MVGILKKLFKKEKITKKYKNGDIYIGEMKNDKPHGYGTYTWPSGEKYVGEFKNDKRYGQGTSTYKDIKYVGGWKEDKMHGQGTTTSNEIKFVGKFKDNERLQGTMTWISGEFAGDKYVGDFEGDEQHGQGSYIWADGSKYVGEYKDGKFHGQGTYTMAEGDEYVGEYKDGKFHGQGTYTWADGSKYVGGWEDGEQCGEGTFTSADGKAEEGVWEKEEPKEKKDGFDFLRGIKKEKLSDKLGKKFLKSEMPDLVKASLAFDFIESFYALKSVEWIAEKYKNRIREKAIDAAKEKLKYQKKKSEEIPNDQLEDWVMDAEKKIKSKDKWTLLKIILLPTGASLLPWL